MILKLTDTSKVSHDAKKMRAPALLTPKHPQITRNFFCDAIPLICIDISKHARTGLYGNVCLATDTLKL